MENLGIDRRHEAASNYGITRRWCRGSSGLLFLNRFGAALLLALVLFGMLQMVLPVGTNVIVRWPE